MKNVKQALFFVILLTAINGAFAQTLILTESEQDQLQDFLSVNNELTQESVVDIICEPIDDIYNLQCPKYQNLVTGTNNYDTAISTAISDANSNGGGVILFPGNTTVEISANITVYSNITFRASHSKATIKCSDSFSANQMVVLSNRENVSFENIVFDGNEKTSGIVTYGTANKNINVLNCVFQNTKETDATRAGIYFQNLTNSNIKNCVFKNGTLGVSFSKRNSHVYIENNKFEASLDSNPIRIQGDTINNDFSDHFWIRGNDIRIKRAPSIIDEHGSLTRDTNTGVVSGLGSINGSPGDSNYDEEYYTWRWERKGPSAIYITCGNTNNSSGMNFHENIVVENNIAVGPDYGFFDGGSADLYSLKDILRLKCVNNVARNSGDLGFAIERCAAAIISGNTADRNNSFGIGLHNTRNSAVSGNVIENNALRRDYIYNSSPYGGMVIAGKSYNNLLEGNHFFSYSAIDVSSPITDSYTLRYNPSDYYGIVIRETYDDTGGANTTESPSKNNIGDNNYSGARWGNIYTQVASTKLNNSFSGTDYPKDADYPLGTWFRNSDLNTTALGWSVVNRVETELHSDWTTGSTYIEVKDPSNSIQKDDIFGVMLDDNSIHWSIIDELVAETGYYKVKLLQMPPSDLTASGIRDPASSRNTSYGMDRIVILRWLTVTK